MYFLITGGCGFVGTNLVLSLLKKKKNIIIIDNFSKPQSLLNYKFLKKKKNIIFFKKSIFDKKFIFKTIKKYKPNTIFHLAGQVAMSKSLINPLKDFYDNVVGTLFLLEAVRLFSKKTKIIYASSNKVYGDLSNFKIKKEKTRYTSFDCKNGFSENLSLNFKTPYGCSKGSADQYVLDYSRIFKINTTVFRHSTIYGGRQFFTSDQGWLGWFTTQAFKQYKFKNRIKFSISGNGKQVRDLLHVDDVVKLYILASKKFKTLNGEVFNIGGGHKNSLSIIELIHILENKFQIKLNYYFKKERINDQKIFISNNSKITKAIGWKPKISIEYGINKILYWIKDSKLYEKL
jgi:CDP-paratose 2-epimerase